MNQCYLALKSLRRLVVAGFEHAHRIPEVQLVWAALQTHQGQFWTMIQSPGNQLQIYSRDLIAKPLMQIAKMHEQMAKQHAASFVLLPGSTALLSSYWTAVSQVGQRYASETASMTSTGWQVGVDGDTDEEMDISEKMALKGLLLLSECVRMVFKPAQTFKYQQPQDKEDKKIASELIKTNVLSVHMVQQLINTLILQFFVLRPSDLHQWQEEPDEWTKREEEMAESWEYGIRSAAEHLFQHLIINFKDTMVPILLQVFAENTRLANNNVFLKESLYTAIGIAAPCLEGKLDFNDFLNSVLIQEVQVGSDVHKILRRRAAIVLGKWVPIKPETINRVPVYQIFAHLLSDDKYNDDVIRITAGCSSEPCLSHSSFHTMNMLHLRIASSKVYCSLSRRLMSPSTDWRCLKLSEQP